MSFWKGVHVFLERVFYLSEKGFISVIERGHIFLERGSCMSRKEFMSVWKGVQL